MTKWYREVAPIRQKLFVTFCVMTVSGHPRCRDRPTRKGYSITPDVELDLDICSPTDVVAVIAAVFV